MIIGGDFSHHNTTGMIMDNLAFIFLKATEGKTYVDPKLNEFMEHIATIRRNSLPIIGFYHYARPENNSVIDEVDNYLWTIKTHIGKCLMALDVEGKALELPKDDLCRWINEFCKRIHDETGVRPFLYTSDYYARLWYPRLDKSIPYWIAHYNVNKTVFQHTDIWQFTSKPCDLDIFYGSVGKLANYAIPGAIRATS